MDEKTASVNIPRDMIEPVIQAHVKAAIVSALGDGRLLIEEAVNRVLSTKVDEHGNPSSYSSAIPLTTYLVRDCIKTAAKEAILEELPKHKDAIRASIKANLSRKNSPIIKAFVDGMTGALADEGRLRYRLKVDFNDRD